MAAKKTYTYTNTDLFDDPDLGDNIHNDANSFYREVMNLKTPIKGGDINIKKLREAISEITLASPHYNFLSKLHRSPWKDMWPEKDYKKPPDNFIGKLWLGVRDSFKSDKSDDVANGSDLNHNKDMNEPYVPLEQFLDEKNKMLIDRLTYFKLLQDKGYSLEGTKKPKKSLYYEEA